MFEAFDKYDAALVCFVSSGRSFFLKKALYFNSLSQYKKISPVVLTGDYNWEVCGWGYSLINL